MSQYRTKKAFFVQTVLFSGALFFGEAVPLAFAETQRKTEACIVNWRFSLCQPASFRSLGKTAAEMEAERRAAFIASEAKRRANAWPTEFVKITKNMKNPNSVKIPFAQAPPISAKTREVDGRRVCEHKSDKGNKSKQDGKDVHIDRECCLDPDEVPNPRCYYPKLGPNNSPDRILGADGKKYIK